MFRDCSLPLAVGHFKWFLREIISITVHLTPLKGYILNNFWVNFVFFAVIFPFLFFSFFFFFSLLFFPSFFSRQGRTPSPLKSHLGRTAPKCHMNCVKWQAATTEWLKGRVTKGVWGGGSGTGDGSLPHPQNIIYFRPNIIVSRVKFM